MVMSHDGDDRIDDGGSKPIRRLSNVGQVRLPHVA